MKRIVLLGSTGSIGRSVLDVVARHPERFDVVGLAARRDVDALRAQCTAHARARVAMADEKAHAALTADGALAKRSVGGGGEALSALVAETRPDLVVNAVVGFAGLAPTLAALEAGIPVAIANKETVVTGGEILMEAARAGGARLIPIDSEHVAVDQCLRGERGEDVDKVWLTASGGALRDRPLSTLAGATVADVLAHPTWNMGRKITVDSATLVNKGLEIIEAHWLFGIPYAKIDAVIHPQSIVHALVQFVDGSIVAQLAEPDMRLPILYALSHPARIGSPLRHDVLAFPDLTFAPVDAARYPCFALALAAAREGGNAPTILNAANEVAVEAFLQGRVAFAAIGEIVEAALAGVERVRVRALDDIVTTDRLTRRWIAERFPVGSGRARDEAAGGGAC
ncbi:MAG: 1-deoxy-D-xylulose-5-phosphate reductoisomerase [Candidatus Krumholzibacteria bacterium]|nr:1-deoxy-D-xylulose-5-phosphate reductoisomerase [Candidatus Krumholzibacteria bacterium]